MSKRSLSRWKKAVVRWRQRLYLNQWCLDISVRPIGKTKPTGSTGEWHPFAQTEYALAYKDAGVVLNKRFQSASDGEMDEKACHEMAHLVVAPLHVAALKLLDEVPKAKRDAYHDWLREAVEETTSDLGRIFQWSVKPNGWRDD